MIFDIVFLLMMVILVFIACMTFFMYRTAKQERILVQDLYFEDFPKDVKELKFFFISDIHRRLISDQLIETVINKANLVIIGGDLTESSVPISRVEQNIVKLKKIGHVYFVWGNNDYDINPNELETVLIKHGVSILANTAISINKLNITLLGIDDISMEKDRFDLALKKCGHEPSFRILISHNPQIKEQLLEEHNIRLVLSGHTHGGQIRIFGYGPYKLGGIEFVGNCLFVISNGFGTSAIPLRLVAKPETHLLTLKSGHHTAIGEQKEIRL